MKEDMLLNLARAAGIQVDWTDARGKKQKLGPDNLRKVLDALGFACASDAQCKESLNRLQEDKASSALPPLVTARAGLPIRLPRQAGLHGRRYRIEFEQGGTFEGSFPADSSLPLEIPGLPAFGYHRLFAGDKETVLAVAPSRAFTVSDALAAAGRDPDVMEHERLWGLAAQLYSLRSSGDGGVGHFGALSTLARSAARHGAAALAISPVHAMFYADRQRFSPYSPSSRLFLNVLHIDPAAVLGPEALQQAIKAAGPDTPDKLARLEKLDLIDWPQAADIRLRLLRHLYQLFRQQAPDPEFDRFKSQGGEALFDHARYEAISSHIENCDWRAWRDGWSNPRSATVDAFSHLNTNEIDCHLFLQWQAARGLAAAQQAARDAGMAIGLIADLAIGADIAGSQAWSRRDQMLLKLSIGAPPDLLNAHGQDWGLGALSPHAMLANGFASYIEMLRAAFAQAGGIRIDHVLGLKRLWLVPEGSNADQGAYLKYPQEDLLRLIALESWRHHAVVIGEDLGTVPPGFSEQMAQAGLLGIRLLWFQRAGERFLAPEEWSPGAISTTTTHDLPTVAGWWSGCDIRWRSKLGLLEHDSNEEKELAQREEDKAALWQAINETEGRDEHDETSPPKAPPLMEAIRYIGKAACPLAILPMEDALNMPEQPNLPGTIDEHPNWRRRLPGNTEGLLDSSEVAERLATLNRSRQPRGEGE
jgi:4-alpha-glucanotransferase